MTKKMLQKRTHHQQKVAHCVEGCNKVAIYVYSTYIYFNKKATYILKESHTNNDLYIRKIINAHRSDTCGAIMQHTLYTSLAIFFLKKEEEDKLQKKIMHVHVDQVLTN